MKELGAFTMLMVIFGVSEMISTKSKAIISSLFAISVIFLAGLWLGIVPKTVFADSGLTAIGTISTGILVTHMGTLISLKDFAKQWRTVLIAAGALLGIFLLVYFLGGVFVGHQYATVAAPPIAGGVIAALMMSEAAKAQNLPMASLLAILLLILQGFIGYPVASFCLKKEGKRLAAEYGKSKGADKTAAAPEPEKAAKKLLPALPKDYQSVSVYLAKLTLVSLLSFWVASIMHDAINKNILCLIFGIAFTEIGFLDTDILTKANSFGFAMAGLMANVFVGLVQVTPAMVGQLAGPIVITLVLGTIGIGIGSIVIGKLLKQSWAMSFAIGTTALFGFPGTYILSNEVAKSMGENEDEKKFIMNQIFPKMMIAGFVTVTIGSVVMAGIMAKML